MSNSDWFLDAPISALSSRADTALFPYLSRLMHGENLSLEESASFFTELTSRDSSPEQIAGCIVALTKKGETFEELAGMAEAMNRQSLKLTTHHKNYIDNSGTGASPVKTFNVSTGAALVTAGAGLAVAKQSSRGITSKSGSADVLNQLDVKIAGEPKLAQACLNGAGIGFLFTPRFHPALLRVSDIKRALGIHSCLDLVSVLSNPSNAPKKLIGVWHESLLEPTAQALALLSVERAWVVHGSDGLDELTLSGKTSVAEVFGNKVRKFEITPEDFGLRTASIDHLRTGSSGESAKIIREVLESKTRDEARSLVVLNAAAALIVGGITDDLMHAGRLAEQSIDSGSALSKLDRLVQTTNKK